MECLSMILFYSGALLFILTTSSATDTILPNQTLKDGDTVVSAGGVFELGFFSLENSSFRYLGIRYKKISVGTVVWVANRQVPLADPSGVLKVNNEGTLQLLSVNKTLIWSSQSCKLVRNISLVAQLQDSGNLILKDDIGGNLIWQSFDYPGDTLLPGMKLGVDLVTGKEMDLTSWKSSADPSSGSHTIRMNINGYPQLYEINRSVLVSRLGFWNGLRLSGMLGLGQNLFYKFNFVLNQNEIYYIYELVSSSFFTRMTLNPEGSFSMFVWSDNNQSWLIYSTSVTDQCDTYNRCGAYGSCNIDYAPACGCLEGFEPLFDQEWSKGDYSSGCKHKIPLTSENGHNFSKFMNLHLPDSRGSWFNSSMALGECEKVCLNNFSCTAFANTDITGGGDGCLLWFGELIDIRDAPVEDGSGQNIYIRMPNLSFSRTNKTEDKKTGAIKVTLPTVSSVVLLGLALTLYAWRKKKRSHLKLKAFVNEDLKQDMELQLFSLNKIVKATRNFSINNKLGEGGFGAVYKGVLEEGREIAVKRLSKTSRQGLIEFQNEVICIAKLQHRNLVRLLGYLLSQTNLVIVPGVHHQVV